MAVTAAMVKELREMTGAGMMDCKKALAATDGDMDKAVEFLREKGLAGATKKAGRIAAEGIVMTKVTADEKKAVVVEVNAETDFVAKNEKFQNYVSDVAEQALNTSAADIDAFLAEKWAKDPSLTVAEALSSQISIIGENMKIRRFAQLAEENGFVASYIHAGGKIGVLVDVETDVVNDAIKEMAKNVAMQAAALKPLYTNDSEVDADYIAKEKEILTVAAKNEKPDANDKIISGMVMGRIKKELKEICLLDQVYVKAEDGKQSVAQYVAQVAKENGAKITVKKFVRFETGEGIEKKEENFAEEVAKEKRDARNGMIGFGLIFVVCLMAIALSGGQSDSTKSESETASKSGSVWAMEATPLDDFDYYIDQNEIYLKDYKGSDEAVYVPSSYTVDGIKMNVVSLDGTFTLTRIHSAIISDGIRYLSDNMFNSCGVEFVYLPASLESFNGWYYFHDVKKIYYGGSEDSWNQLCTVDRSSIDVQQIIYDTQVLSLIQ